MSSVKGESSTGKQRAIEPLVGSLHKDIKMETPQHFAGEKSKLKGFLVQLNLYLTFHAQRFASPTERVLYAITLLKGEALNWIEGFAHDYLTHAGPQGQVMPEMRPETRYIFSTFEGFLERLNYTFGDFDEVKQAVRKIQSLKQKGSAATYTAEFNRYSIKTGWNDAALKDEYYKGLKEVVKDELSRTDFPDTFKELTEDAIRIDNRFYERAQEKKGFYDPTSKKRYNHGNHYGSQPMELDAIGRKELSPQERQTYMEKKLCFGCGKPGHMARNCKSGKNKRYQHRKGEINAMNRRGYNGPMECNASFVGTTFGPYKKKKTNFVGTFGARVHVPAPQSSSSSSSQEDKATQTRMSEDERSEDDFEHVTQSLEAVNFVKTEGNDVNSDSSDAEDSEGSQGQATPDPEPEEEQMESEGTSSQETLNMTRQEERDAHILAGVASAWKYLEESKDDFHDAMNRIEKRYGDCEGNPALLIKKAEDVIDAMRHYRTDVVCLELAIKKQMEEMDEAAKYGIQRSQQYRDKLAVNIDLLPHLRKEFDGSIEKKELAEQQLEEFRKAENVARIDHPRHAELAWSFCYTDKCTIHKSSKEGSGYWPRKQKPVYWTKIPETMVTHINEAGMESKN
jgi:hypothetical protein